MMIWIFTLCNTAGINQDCLHLQDRSENVKPYTKKILIKILIFLHVYCITETLIHSLVSYSVQR